MVVGSTGRTVETCGHPPAGAQRKDVRAMPEQAVQMKGTQTGSAVGKYSQTEEFIKNLQKELPGMELHILDLKGTAAIRDYAKTHYGVMQAVITPEALKRMMEEPEFFRDCLKELKEIRKQQAEKISGVIRSGRNVIGSGMVIGDDGTITQWFASAKTAAQKRKENGFQYSTVSKDGSGFIGRNKTDKGFLTLKRKVTYIPAHDLQKIARSATQAAVRQTISGIRARIYQLKTSGDDKKAARQLAAQAEQVLLKAKVKLKNLNKESLLRIAAKKAESREEMRKALRMKLLLEEKKTRRKSREYGQIRDYYPSPYERELRRHEELQKMAETGNLAYNTPGSPAAPSAAAYGMPPESAGTSSVIVDISV